jgi:hypothetical protein
MSLFAVWKTLTGDPRHTEEATEAASATSQPVFSPRVHDLRNRLLVLSACTEMLAAGGAGPVTDAQRALLARLQQTLADMERLLAPMPGSPPGPTQGRTP